MRCPRLYTARKLATPARVPLTIVWFRQDLRLQDNPALLAAARRGAVLPVYLLDDAGEGPWAMGAASRWWLHHSLDSLGADLRERGSRLVLGRGGSSALLRSLVGQSGADAVFWNRRYEPAAIARDAAIKAELADAGVEARSFAASVLFEPHTVRNKSGGPFQVFTPFWKHCLALKVDPPERLPAGRLAGPAEWPPSLGLAELGLLPSIRWDAGFRNAWQPGEAGALRRLAQFTRGPIERYADERDLPGRDATSSLSPHLHFGEIGPRQVWSAASGRDPGTHTFQNELGWREFAHHVLYHFPRTPEAPLRAEYAAFPWRSDPGQLRAWQRGLTGYPIVDAGMRQLWATGWMHNRVRMIVASFLVKHLRLPWREGAAWFWDTLVDADLASNTLGWQWSAGCGADAAPYFRIFNPILQGGKFDAEGGYVRRWVPELARLRAGFIHRPWEASSMDLNAAGVRLGSTYPLPIVDHAHARQAALAALQALRKPRPG